jgi:hypothetical protein
MKLHECTRAAVGVSAVAAILSGCSGDAGSLAAPAAGQPGTTSQALHGKLNYFVGVGQMKPARAVKAKSWMSDVARNSKLVYYSDAVYGTVNVYSFPDLKPMGQLTGFSEPQGMCSVPTRPQTGNWWVVNTSGSNLVEYAHAGSTPIATIDDSGQYPVDCSSDITTGDLAVSNIITTSGGTGSINVYTSPSAPPTNYAFPGMGRAYNLTYDNAGNLFADGSDASGNFVLAELPKGGSAFTVLNFPVAVGFPGGLGWDWQTKGHVVTCDQLGPCYQFEVAHFVVTITGTFTLQGSGDVAGFAVTPSKLVGADAGLNRLAVYTYPGGTVFKSISGGNSGGQPIGAAISIKHL